MLRVKKSFIIIIIIFFFLGERGVRKFHFLKHRKFFRVDFLYFLSSESYPLKFIILRIKKFHLLKYKNFKYILRYIRKFHFLKYKKSFLWKNIINFLRGVSFLLGLKVASWKIRSFFKKFCFLKQKKRFFKKI